MLNSRYAAKEAVIKAHRSRQLTFHDIWIESGHKTESRSRAPETRVISVDGSWEDSQIVPLNISHDTGYATAVCLAEDDYPSTHTETDTRELGEVTHGNSKEGKQPSFPRDLQMEVGNLRQKSTEEVKKRERLSGRMLEMERKLAKIAGEMNIDRVKSDPVNTVQVEPRIWTIPTSKRWEAQQRYLRRKERRIVVSNLNPDVTNVDLLGLFSRFSNSVKARLRQDPDGRTSTRSAFLTFETKEEAHKAREAMDGKLFLGQKISCREIGEGELSVGKGTE